ncbi:tRNA (adenine(58)-N(1))-methyltransferase catalytic subunit TRM61, putative [Plasmodium sp. gorilla clade G2]|uniref:tRNA (adenine(58)-N(1))-methyltransferase catalytic subunit TRM61, putative n=1 Tax=Plasmodium sp. gorilla clade G2 TaxID=880535 RepID=UPI000D21CDE2|nr:tRNA (adenine(58)-N(1))-methyltransferase catalytic subunit TRM61, putative [Plasmodium sp. gorilla clade G2]SOV17593.1 tRNA (adenine(58)-N(1))-methyltransferase catalytic subunit TRM61, putative [Plasmodium sp. gorilla clade G2]
MIKEGNCVVIYSDEENIDLLKLTNDGIINNKKGRFLHKDIIGKEYGSKIYDTLNKNYIYVLKRSPELIANCLKKKTQTLYEHDISFICLVCNALPNKNILEAGTGTGCLTYALANSVLPNGMIHTFEYNEERYKQVQQEFDDFENIRKNITFHHKDILNYNFDDFPLEYFDSIFLDMPNPWLCVDNIKKVLKERGVFVIFLPCIEQVYKILEALEKNSFCDIVTYELINKSWKIIINKKKKNKNNDDDYHIDNTVCFNSVNNDDKKVDNIDTLNNFYTNYRLCQKENKTHTGYLTIAKRSLKDEDEQPEIKFENAF